MIKVAIRSVSIAAVALLAASAQAQNLTLPTNALVAESVQTFSEPAMQSYQVFGVTIKALGNTTKLAENKFNLPVTSVTAALSGGLKVKNGKATGSALEISRVDSYTGKKHGMVLANFTIDFEKSQVLADTTDLTAGTFKAQAPVYNFVKLSDLAAKYKFPYIYLVEKLGDLRIADVYGTVDALGIDPALGDIIIPTIDFGVIDIDIGVKLRIPAVSTRAYQHPL